MVNAVFPKQNLIPALGYIKDSKWMCGTIDFFLPLFEGKKQNESTQQFRAEMALSQQR